MDPFVGYIDSGEHVFSTELDDILNTPWTEASNEVEEAKRIYVASILARFLHLCAACFDTNLSSEQSQFHCIQRLFESTAFRDDHETIPMHQLAAEEAIRIMQTSTSVPVLLMVYEVVLQYGEAFPSTYKSIQASASAVSFAGVRAFLHRLVHQIWAGSYAAQAEAKLGFMQQQQSSSNNNNNNNNGKGLTSSSASKDIAIQISLREKAVRMLYEVCRVQKLEPAHLKAFDQRFIHHLFDLVEETRFHHDEDFNYRLIKLLVAINEQYMVVATAGAAAVPLNLVLNVLQQRLNASKTFGENLIFMLNRASSSDAEDVCMQLLVLKLLYLLFTTKETACYFYTNDLRVLVDIFIRELSDLPDESESLRHTYLRVLHPLLTNTQLCTYAYKRTQIRVLLQALVSHGHLRDISSTTRRLVDRCLKAEWCVELARLDGTSTTATVEPIGGGPSHEKQMLGGVTSEGLPVLLLVAEEATEAKQVSVTTNAGEPPICASAISVPVRKRVVSLSNTPQSPQDIVVRPGSAAASLGGGRRTVSAQSAPCTPPRIATPVRQDSDAGSEFDDVTSISSSWHAHMAEDISGLPAPRRRKPPQPPQLVARRALGESSISPTSEQRPASPLATAGASRRRPPPPPPAPRDDQDTDSNTADTLCIADRLRRGLRIR